MGALLEVLQHWCAPQLLRDVIAHLVQIAPGVLGLAAAALFEWVDAY